ncbi:hypothetical protein BD410DRAFT_797402 [Rickenella mellea]|uniref:Uncharacterized protein n=1 Tax=Rickenella mellea TaxID=50990 RepID=A0A4Y7PGJ9_9AGAM|nr:hypothetical protein BD410DRAFT_797402 [Rickenella mellea]
MLQNGIYIVTYFRASTGGVGLFHWGIVIKTADSVKSVRHHATLLPSWCYEEREHDFETSQAGILALKIGNIPADWARQHFRHLFGQIPVADTGDFTCRVWALRAVHCLVTNLIIQCPDIGALEAEVKNKSEPLRSHVALGGRATVQISDYSR